MKTFKERHPVYVLYKSGRPVAYLHAVAGKLLPCNSMTNYWVRSISSGQSKIKNSELVYFAKDNAEGVASWVSHYKARRVVRVIREMEYKGYDE